MLAVLPDFSARNIDHIRRRSSGRRVSWRSVAARITCLSDMVVLTKRRPRAAHNHTHRSDGGPPVSADFLQPATPPRGAAAPVYSIRQTDRCLERSAAVVLAPPRSVSAISCVSTSTACVRRDTTNTDWTAQPTRLIFYLFIYLFICSQNVTYILPCTKRAGQQGTDNRH